MNQPICPPHYEEIVPVIGEVRAHEIKLRELFLPLDTARDASDKAKAIILQIGTPKPDDDDAIAKLAIAEKKLQISEAAVSAQSARVVEVVNVETAPLVERAGRMAAELLYYTMVDQRNVIAGHFRKHCETDQESHELAAQTAKARAWVSRLHEYLDAHSTIRGSADSAKVIRTVEFVGNPLSDRLRSTPDLGRFLN